MGVTISWWKSMDYSAWIEIMRYIREAPGKLYEDQLERLLNDRKIVKSSDESIDHFLNSQYNDEGKLFLKIDPVTKGIYTVPSQREALDKSIADNYASSLNEYKYNEYLYMENLPDENFDGAKTMCDILSCKKMFNVDPISKDLYVDLTELGSGSGQVIVRDFDINGIIDKFNNDGGQSFDFGKINASGILFLGNTCLRINDSASYKPRIKKGMCFSEATFAGDMEVGNIEFEFSSSDKNAHENCSENKIDFRNARFFGDALFRDISFCGDEPDMEISFEDARVQNSLKFVNIDFGHASVNLFQTVIGGYVWHIPYHEVDYACEYKNSLEFKNVTFSDDSQIDLSDTEMNNTKIIFENIPSLPLSRICLSPVKYSDGSNISDELCPNCYLLIKNCEIQKTLYIGNVSALSFCDSCNYGKIIAAANWGIFPVKKSEGHKISIFNPLLKAIYNNNHYSDYGLPPDKKHVYYNMLCYSKAKDFVMMKENFNAAGKYDEEDEAFILYMEYKPYVNYMYRKRDESSVTYPKKDLFTDLLYRILYSVGRYGISPVKVLFSLSATVIIFSAVYYSFACSIGPAAFDIGKVGYGSLGISDWIGNVVPSVIFSICNIVPFVSQFEPINIWVCICTIVEAAVGSFLVGYFSVAVVRKTLR